MNNYKIRNIATININGIRSFTTKILLKKFITDNDIDIILLQEINESDLRFFKPFEVIININENQRSTAILTRPGIELKNVIFYENSRIIGANIDDINLINICAHAVNGQRAQREKLIEEDIASIIGSNKSNIMIAGDFNCVLNVKDQKGRTNYSAALNRLLMRGSI